MRCATLYSGSSGNSIYLENDDTKILIDAGVSGRKIEKGLADIGVSVCDIDAILVSHEHSDHVSSLGILSKKHDIPVFASQGTWNNMKQQSEKLSIKNMISFNPDKWFSVGSFDIFPFKIPHDAVEPCGFSVCSHGKKVTIATDMGHINPELIKNMESSDLLLIEANHDIEMLRCGTYPWFLKRRILGENGHLSNEVAATTIRHLVKGGMRKFFLGHLSRENNFPELAYQTVINALTEIGVTLKDGISVGVAPRNGPSSIMELV
jgi:phosphoribosyl 1,2-cyclic phosphodiesterase